jgi:beta-lactamase regulating signal transducer with metallopeptidase domain
MIRWMQSLGSVTVLEAAGTLIVQITLISGVLLLVARRLPRDPVLRHYLLLCGLGLIVALPLALPYGQCRIRAIPRGWQSGDAPRAQAGQWSDAAVGAPSGPQLADRLAAGPAGPEQAGSLGVQAAGTAGSQFPRIDWQLVPPLLFVVWGLGGLIVVARLLRAARIIRRYTRQLRPLSPDERRRAEGVWRAAGVRRLPPIAVSGAVRVPVVSGFRRPQILLPTWLLPELTDGELRNVLLHEWAHIARHDQYVVLLQELAGAMFWWHPLVRRLNTQLADAREEVCDNWALQSSDPIHYGETLLRIGSRAVSGTTAAYSLSVAARQGTLCGRIARLLDPERKQMTHMHRNRALVCLAGFGLLGGLFAVTRLQFTQAAEITTAEPATFGTATVGSAAIDPAANDTADEKAEKELSGRIYLSATIRQDDERQYNLVLSIVPRTGEWKKLTEGHSPRVSPDGRTVMFYRDDEVWSAGAASASSPGVVAKGMTGRIGWTPDSRHVIISPGKYIDDQGWEHATHQISVDGFIRKSLPIPATDGVDDVSPDGQWLVTVSDRHRPHGSGYQLYRMRLDGSEQERLTKDGLNVYARFSPDGRKIAYVHQKRGEGNSLHIYDFTDKSDVRITEEQDARNSVVGACWSPDGQRLLVVRFDWEVGEGGGRVLSDPENANYRLELMQPDGSEVQRLSLQSGKLIWASLPDWR